MSARRCAPCATTAVLDTAGRPLDLAVGLAASGRFDPCFVHEGPHGWSVAGGAAAELVLRPGTLRRTVLGETSEQEWTGDPLDAVRGFLAALPLQDWSAYGWCAFELAHALPGGAAPQEAYGDDTEVLLHLLVPRTELRLTGTRAQLRSWDGPAGLAAAREALTRIDADAQASAEPAAPAEPVRVDLEAGAEEYRRGVAAVVEEIGAGALQKAVLSREVPVAAGTEVDFPASFRSGRRANTPARSFLFDLGGLRCFGFSPETVVEVGADGRAVSQPLAGTRALTGDAATDAGLRAELSADPKEVHEHAISVKLAVEELSGVCPPGSVVVEEFMAVKERGSVQHLASTVAGRLPAGADAWDAFAAVFPAVTASGVPKPAAYRAITRHEPARRGPYAGAVLRLTADGALDAALVLRSVYARGGRTWLRAGAGIVGQSRPERELEETREKLRSVADCLLAQRD